MVNDYTGTLEIILYDMKGNTLMEKTYKKVAKEYRQQLPVEYGLLPPGQYFLNIKAEVGGDQFIRFIKE